MKDLFINPSLYFITEDGHVYSKNYRHTWKTKQLKEVLIRRYLHVKISFNIKWKYYDKYFKLHRLMWVSFLGLDYNNKQMFVCHKDDNPLNNNLSNLFLWTAKDNHIDAANKGRLCRRQWIDNPKNKFTKDQIFKIYDMYFKQWILKNHIAKQFWVTRNTIHYIVTWVYRKVLFDLYNDA